MTTHTEAPNGALMEALTELRRLFPDWRVGQMIANLTQAAGREGEAAVWEVEDEDLLAAAQRLIARNRGRLDANP